MKKIKTVEEFKKCFEEILQKGEGIIMFSADGCPFCREAEKQLKDMDNLYEVMVNDQTYDIIRAFEVSSTPTFVVVKNKEIKRKVIGYAETVRDYILAVLRGEVP